MPTTILSLSAALALAVQDPAAAPPVPGATAAPASGAVTGQLLVWSGATRREEAEAQLRALEELLPLLADFFEPGLSPAVLESAAVTGLKPGFFVVALGVCPARDEPFALGVFRAIYPDVYAKPVSYVPSAALPALKCPRPAIASALGNGEPAPWSLERAQVVEGAGGRLSALLFSYSESTIGDFLREYAGVRGVFLLTDPRKRTLRSSASWDGPSDFTKLRALKAGARTVTLELEFADPPCDPRGDRYAGFTQDVTVAVARGEITVDEGRRTQTGEGSCGYEEEGRMIGGPRPD